MNRPLKEAVSKSLQTIKDSSALLIVAGAGMGIDSGLPDYRGPNGLWNTWHPARKLKMRYEDLSTHQLFESDPSLAWGFQSYLTRLYHQLEPHQGYYLLLELGQRHFKNNYFVITSNVDSQFLRAGFHPEQLYEVHGTKRLWQCMNKACNKNHFPWEMTIDQLPEIDSETLYAKGPFPKCPHCGLMARPNVSFFKDFFFNEKQSQVQSSRLYNWLEKNKRCKLVIIELGCGTSEHSIRFQLDNQQYRMRSNEWKLPRSFLSHQNCQLIRINPDQENETETIQIPLGAMKGLKLISQKCH